MKHVLFISCLFLLSACLGDGQDDLQEWKRAQAALLKPDLKPLPEIEPFPVVSYETADILDPFQMNKITPDKKAGGGLAPDFDRPKEELEKFPLDAIKFMGLIRKGNVVEAVVKADNKVYRVKPGMHLGQDYGKVVAIVTSSALDEGQLKLKETVQDTNGDWVERDTTIELQRQGDAK